MDFEGGGRFQGEATPIEVHLLTINEAATRAGVSCQTVHDWVRRGHLAVVQSDDGPLRVRSAEVQRLQELRRIAAASHMRIATVQQWIFDSDSQAFNVPYENADGA